MVGDDARTTPSSAPSIFDGLQIFMLVDVLEHPPSSICANNEFDIVVLKPLSLSGFDSSGNLSAIFRLFAP